MSLKYKILWVDDKIDTFLDTDISDIYENIVSHIVNLGYTPMIDTCEDITDAKKYLKSTKYDLILSDYNMDGGNGDTLIEDIRKGKIYTEVLFYTAQSQIKEIAKTLFADRVSFHSLNANDRNNTNFKNKIIWLINQTLKKLQELNTVRGLVMSETSHLDTIIEDILIFYFNSEHKNIDNLRTSMLSKIENSLKSNFREGKLKIASETNIKIVKSRIFDADKKARVINDLLKIELGENNTTFYQDYKKEVLDIRNKLAHSKTSWKGKIEYLIIEKGEETNYEELKQDDFIQIRKNLLKYHKKLNMILSSTKKPI